MFNAMPYDNEPWDRKDMTDTLHYFNIVVHKGNIHFDVRFDGAIHGQWCPGMNRVDAKSNSGWIQGNLRIGWLANAFVDMQATHGCDLRLVRLSSQRRNPMFFPAFFYSRLLALFPLFFFFEHFFLHWIVQQLPRSPISDPIHRKRNRRA